MDARDELRRLAEAYVSQAKPIVREQERIVAQLGDPLTKSLSKRVAQTVALTLDTIAEQESLVETLKE